MQYSIYTGLQDVSHSGLVKHDFSYCKVDPMQSYGTLVIYGSVTEDVHYIMYNSLVIQVFSLAVQLRVGFAYFKKWLLL